METIKMNLKEESASSFFKENMIDYQNVRQINSVNGNEVNVYNLMKDEIYLKRNCGLSLNDKLCIELIVFSLNSGKDLINHYTYEVIEYDDYSVKLQLIDIKITLKD